MKGIGFGLGSASAKSLWGGTVGSWHLSAPQCKCPLIEERCAVISACGKGIYSFIVPTTQSCGSPQQRARLCSTRIAGFPPFGPPGAGGGCYCCC